MNTKIKIFFYSIRFALGIKGVKYAEKFLFLFVDTLCVGRIMFGKAFTIFDFLCKIF